MAKLSIDSIPTLYSFVSVKRYYLIAKGGSSEEPV